MQYDSHSPTVAGLLAARSTSAFIRTEPCTGPGVEGLLVEALSSALRPGTAVVRRPLVDTPLGSRSGLLAVVARGRRIAVVDRRIDARDLALVLVFGTFDAVYRASERDLVERAPAVADAIVSREPRLFTERGRAALGLCAATSRPRRASVPAEDRPARRPTRAVELAGVPVVRLNRPTEWAEALEHALGGRGFALSA